MGIKTQEQLINLLAENSGRRKHELISLRQAIKSKKNHEQEVFCRLAIVMAYAHWEGFVKDSSIAYVEYVESRKLVFEQLATHFQALAYKKKMFEVGSLPRKILPYIEVINLAGSIVSLSPKTMIETNSNLNYENFENIYQSIGINSSFYWLSQKPFIDELVKNRCSIAHGGLDIQNYQYADEVLDKVIKFIDSYRTDLENLAVTDAHCRNEII